jgi:predicted secreted protein
MAISGKNAGLYVGAVPTKVAEVSDVSLNAGSKNIDVTNFDSNEWTENIMGTKNWKISATCNFKVDDTNGQRAIMDAILNAGGSAIAAKLQLSSTANPSFSGNVVVTSFDVGVPVADKVTVKFELTGTGALAYTAS